MLTFCIFLGESVKKRKKQKTAESPQEGRNKNKNHNRKTAERRKMTRKRREEPRIDHEDKVSLNPVLSRRDGETLGAPEKNLKAKPPFFFFFGKTGIKTSSRSSSREHERVLTGSLF